MTAHALAKKLRRAIQLGKGATFTNAQCLEFKHYGILKKLSIIEADEICPETTPPLLSVITGSTNGGTDSPPISGKSPTTNRERAPLSIGALSAGL